MLVNRGVRKLVEVLEALLPKLVEARQKLARSPAKSGPSRAAPAHYETQNDSEGRQFDRLAGK